MGLRIDGLCGHSLSSRKGIGLLALTLLVPGLASAAGGEREAKIYWQGKEHTLAAVPEEIGAEPQQALREWAAFAAEHKYRMELSKDGRVLLLIHGKKKSTRQLKEVEATLALFDSILPRPRSDFETEAKPTTDDGPVAPLDRATLVLIQAQQETAYRAAVDCTASADEYLHTWAPSARKAPGFILEQPLVAAWRMDDTSQEEFSEENELVHRLMRLLVMRRFGQQPYWLTLGLAWFAEHRFFKTVYCMPYRNSFVGMDDHGNWGKGLRLLAKRDKDGLQIGELTNLRRGSYQDAAAFRAWGAAKHLASLEPGVLGEILEDFRNLRDHKGIKRDGYKWQRIAGYEVDEADQIAVLRARAGDDVLEDFQKAYLKAKSR